MAIRNDYLLDMIQSFTLSILHATGETDRTSPSDAMDDYNDVVGRILDMPAEAALALSPESLVTIMRISAIDDRLAVYMCYVLQRMADILDGTDAPLAEVRRAQARAIADAYGFPTTEVPPEVQDGLDSQSASTDAS